MRGTRRDRGNLEKNNGDEGATGRLTGCGGCQLEENRLETKGKNGAFFQKREREETHEKLEEKEEGKSKPGLSVPKEHRKYAWRPRLRRSGGNQLMIGEQPGKKKRIEEGSR